MAPRDPDDGPARTIIGIYTSLAFHMNSLADRGAHESIADVKAHIADETIFEWLFERHDELPAYGWFKPEGFERREALERMQGLVEGYSPNTWHVANNGINLLCAYAIEIVQQLLSERDVY